MALSVPIDTREITITPVFKHVNVEDIPASERAGHAVMKSVEAVEVRFAGSNLYSPTFPVNAMWRREGHRVLTYAERWAEQYRAFKQGEDQHATGTPLEMLKPYGITPSQLSLCRVWKIYSIEALHHLEGSALKNLQMNGNDLKRMAAAYMSERANGSATMGEIERLRAEIAAMKAAIPAADPTPAEMQAVTARADIEFEAMSSDELKDHIAAKTGEGRPRGNPSHDTLVGMARELA
jgi:hypothetical protein